MIYYKTDDGILYQGDVLETLKQLPSESVNTIVTSPPYWGLRDYGVDGQIGLEPALDEYIKKMLQITLELKRVLKKTGIMFWNHGSNYINKNNTLQNYRLIIRMIDEQGWILRNPIIWYKPNHMPSSVKDGFANSYEPVFFLTQHKSYWFDLDAVRVPYTKPINRWGGEILKAKGSSKWDKGTGQNTYRDRNMRPNILGKNPGDVWTIPTQSFPEAHFATYPEKLIEPMIKAGCPQWICKKCGKARERIIEPTEEYKKILGKSWHDHKNDEMRGQRINNTVNAQYVTIGWTDCGCNAGWESGVVLDPFMGSGTTAVVARKLHRRWIGIELNPEYCEMAKNRIKKVPIQYELFL